MSGGRDVARAIDALRRGWPVTIDAIAFLAVETTDDDGLAQFDGEAPADLLISGNRGATLKLANQRDGTPAGPVRIARSGSIGLDAAIAIADPSLDLASPLKGPFHTVALAEDEAAAEAALRLARLAGLLPAFFLGGSGTPALAIASATVLEFDEADSLAIASRARLPTRYAEKGEVVAFRSELDATEHVALLVGEPGGEPPLIRLHSECLTGDVLASLKCDCGPQLDDALAAIAASGWGILLYLRQEGRGIGLINKLRAYALQDQGFDTMEANVRLGFAEDERDFEVAARMLELLGQDEVRLLTNNPDKAAALTAAGITIAAVVPLKAGRNPHNTAYLDTKRKRGGHRL